MRYYDKEGLIPTVKKNEKGTREFCDDDLAWLKMVECLKKSGMPLKDIKQFLDWCNEDDSSLKERQDMFHERKKFIEQQIAQLQQTLNVVKYKCWYYDTAVELGSEAAIKDIPIEKVPKEIQAVIKKMQE